MLFGLLIGCFFWLLVGGAFACLCALLFTCFNESLFASLIPCVRVYLCVFVVV